MVKAIHFPPVLSVVCGPMFAGKTKRLIGRVRGWLECGETVLVVVPDIDAVERRPNGLIEAHDGTRLEPHPNLTVVDLSQAGPPPPVPPEVTRVAVDEAQFFHPWIVAWGESLVPERRVLMGGLDLTFEGKPFGSMPELLASASKVSKIQAACRCGEPAHRTHRKVTSAETILVGGAREYEPLCLGCFRDARAAQIRHTSFYLDSEGAVVGP